MTDNKSGSDAKQVRDVMTPNPKTVTEKDSVQAAAKIMADQDTGVVPVVDGLKIIGMVTDRDIVVRLIATGKDLSRATIHDTMTRTVRSVKDDAPVSEVLHLMSSAQIRRVPVVNQKDELVGIVSIGDLASETGQAGKIGKTVEDISEAKPNN
ncbi:MAG: CBS domain-containing protein [Acidobacteriota bacterium]